MESNILQYLPAPGQRTSLKTRHLKPQDRQEGKQNKASVVQVVLGWFDIAVCASLCNEENNSGLPQSIP